MRNISTIQRILFSAYEIGLEGMLNLYTLGTHRISKQITAWEPALGEAGEKSPKEDFMVVFLFCFVFPLGGF